MDDTTENISINENVQQQSTETQFEDPNWKAVREQRKLERKAREEAERRAAEKAAEAEALKKALEALTNKPDNYFNQSDEDEEEKRIQAKVEKALKEKEEKYAREREERERREFPERLKRQYHDFNKVCDAENLDYLEYHYPELVKPFQYMPEGYEKWDALYKLTKKFVPNLNKKEDEKKVEKNLSKPSSISSVGTNDGISSNPYILSEERRKQNWERMQRTLKGLSN